MNKQTKREMMNSKKTGQKRSQYGNKQLVIFRDLNQRKKSRSSQQGISSGRNDIGEKSTQGTSKKNVTVQPLDKTKFSLKPSCGKQVSRPPSTTGKRKLSKYDIVSPKDTQSREHNIPRSTTSSRKGESVSLIKCLGNIYNKQQSKLQPSETDAKNVQLKNNAAQTRYRPEQSVVSKLLHGQSSSLPSSQQTDDRKVSPTNDSRNVDRNRLKLQPAVTKPDTFHTKPLDKQATNALKKENVNDQRRSSTASEKSSEQSSAFCSVRPGDDRQVSPETNPRNVDRKPFQLLPAVTKPDTFHTKPLDKQATNALKKENVNGQRRSSTASEKSSGQSSAFCSVRLGDNSCISPDNNSKNDCSNETQLDKQSSGQEVDNRHVSPETNPRNVDTKPLQLNSAVGKPDTLHIKPTDMQGTNLPKNEGRSSTASEKSYCSVRSASQENNSNDDCSKQVQGYPTSPVLTTNSPHYVDNNTFNNKRILCNTSVQPNEISFLLRQNVVDDDLRKLPLVKKQSFDSNSSFLSVGSHISANNNSGINNDNDHLQSSPDCTGRNTFLTQPNGAEDEWLLEEVTYKQLFLNSFQESLEPYLPFTQRDTTNEQQSSCSVHELSFGRDPSTCSFQQADNARVENSLGHYPSLWRPPVRNSCQEINENRSNHFLCGGRSKERDSATIVQPDMTLEIKELQPYLNFIRDVSIKTEDDSQPCQITGFCQLENGTIVLTELNNKAIKTLNCQNYIVIDTMPLSNYPFDICTMEESEACVILYKSSSQCKCICISINVHDIIELKREKVLKHDCICVAYCNEKMFVGNSECKGVYIYDKNWNKIDTISNDLVGIDEVFSNQFSISVSVHDNETTIYIADEDNGMHYIIDTGLEIENRWKFKDHESFKATGMCRNSQGDILLVDRDSQRLIKMNTAGMILAILLDNRKGNERIDIPLQNKKNNNNLIISLFGKDFIRVFGFK